MKYVCMILLAASSLYAGSEQDDMTNPQKGGALSQYNTQTREEYFNQDEKIDDPSIGLTYEELMLKEFKTLEDVTFMDHIWLIKRLLEKHAFCYYQIGDIFKISTKMINGNDIHKHYLEYKAFLLDNIRARKFVEKLDEKSMYKKLIKNDYYYKYESKYSIS